MPEPAFTLPGIRVHLPRNRCSRSPESVFTMLWNGCSPSAGICVHDAPEYAYKLRIVREADACKGDGDVAALLRREGLYSSHLSSWRRQRDEIAKAGLTSRKRGRKAKAEAPRIKELERENARLQRRLARVETMLEIQKKASELLGIPLNPIGDDEND